MRAFVVAQYGKDGIYATDLPMKSLTVLKPGGWRSASRAYPTPDSPNRSAPPSPSSS